MNAAGEHQLPWVLGCACAKCGRRTKIFNDVNGGRGPIVAPLRGEFGFRCPHCGGDNTAHVAELERFVCEDLAFAQA